MKLSSWIGAAFLAAFAATAACGGGTPPPSSSDPAGTGERISGNERIGWNQPVDAGQSGTLRYVAYVDGNRVELADATCGASTGSALACNSRLPPMTPGAHTIELASFVVDSGVVVESGRSAALRVTVTGATSNPLAPVLPPTTLLTTADGAELRLDLLSEELTAPTALAVAPDGRVFVAEREGRVRILRNGALDPLPAVVIDEVAMTASLEGGLLALALDAQFERTRFVYAVYTVAGPDETRRFRLVRYREVDGRLGERVVLLERIPAAARPAASLGLGPDGQLYVAFDAVAATGRTAALASYNGKVLRLTTDGTTPRDEPAGLPVFVDGIASPRGMDWDPLTGAFTLLDVKPPNVEELRVVAPSADGRSMMRGRITLPAGSGAAGMAFYRGTLLPALTGDLLVAAAEGRYLLRLRFDRRDPPRLVASERLLEDIAGPIRAVAVSAAGVVYVATDGAVLRLGGK